MAPRNPYREAPTHLTNLDGESKLFKTQLEVDRAWKDGWFGPPWLAKSTPLISDREAAGEFQYKRDLEYAVAGDPRYKGLNLIRAQSLDITRRKIIKFEKEHDLERVIVESGA